MTRHLLTTHLRSAAPVLMVAAGGFAAPHADAQSQSEVYDHVEKRLNELESKVEENEGESGSATTLEVYGALEPYIATKKDDEGESRSDFTDNGSIIGFSGDHRLGNGLTVFGVAEFEFLLDSSDNSFALDEGYLGAEGDFGRVQLGNFDSVYEDLIIDATEVAELAEITDEAVSSEDNQIAYYSPSLNGFAFRAQVRYFGDGEENNDTDSAEAGLSLAGGYTGSNWGIYAGYDDRGAERVTQYDANGKELGFKDFADEGTYGLAGTYELGAVEMAAKYAVQELTDNHPNGDDKSFAALRSTFNYGSGDLYAAVQDIAHDQNGSEDDRTELTVGIAHGVTEELELWAEAGRFDKENDAGDIYGVGAIYEF